MTTLWTSVLRVNSNSFNVNTDTFFVNLYRGYVQYLVDLQVLDSLNYRSCPC